MNQLNPSDVATFLSSEFCVRLTQALAHFLWQGFSIGIAVWMVDRLLPRTSSRFRYSAGVAALLTMLTCVPLTYVALGFFPGNSPAQTAGDVSMPADHATAESSFAGGTTISELPVDASVTSLRPADNVDRAVPTSATGNQPNAWLWQSLHSLLTRLAPYATVAYLLGVAIMLARLALALRGSHKLRQSAAPLADPAILAMAVRQARRIGLKVVPAIAWCQRAAVPLVVGIVRPMVLLPTAIAGGVSPGQLEALLAHELAHLKRLDLAVNLVQRLAESVLFFHPAVWYVSRRISIERENCCDDCVLAAGWGRVEYADALVRMAEVCATARGLAGLEGAALLAASGETPSQFKRRVLRLLDAQDHLRVGISRGWLLAAVGAMVLALAAIPLAIGRKDKAAAGQPEKAQTADAEALPEEAPLPDVHASLRFLASRQNDDGSFGSGDFPLDRSPALTAICGLALVRGDIVTDMGPEKAAGFIPAKYPRYRDKAIEYVLKQQRDSGLLAGDEQPSNTLMYNHAFAMWFLAEAAAAGSKVAVKEPLQKAVALTVGAQNQEGGWRYLPKPDDADAHVTAVQLLALAAARRARIEVPQEVIDKGVGYLRRCRDEPSGGFAYQPGLKPTSFSRSALVLAAIISAAGADDQWLKPSIDYLVTQASEPRQFDPELYAGDGRFFALVALRGSKEYDDQWRQLDRQFRAELLRERQPEGSWREPKVGPERATAMACLALLAAPPVKGAKDEPRPAGAAAETKKLYLRGQDALDRIDKVKPAWSEVQDGVEFGIARIGDKKKFRSGERVPLEMFVRNVGKEGVEISLAAEFYRNVPEIKSKSGEAIPLEQLRLTGNVPVYREFLKPGEAFGFRHRGVGLGPNPNPKEIWHPYWAEPNPGNYTLRHTHEIDVDPANGLVPGKRVKFTSGVVEFEVVDGAQSDRGPPADDATRTLQAALLDRREYLEGTFPNDERLIKSELFVAEQKLARAQTSLDHAKRLAAKGLVTPLQVQAAELTLNQAQGEVEKAQAKLDVLRKFTKEKTLAELNRKVAKAIEELLDQHVALKVTDRPLIFVLDDLEKAHKIPVTIDLKEVHARGLSEQARVTVDVADTPLREVFRAVLAKAGLSFEVTAEGIFVPASSKAAEKAQAWGDLTVQFVYDGPKPEVKKLPVPRDIGTFGAEALDESLLVGDKGELANVAVYLTSAGIPIHPEARRRAEKPAELKVTGAGTRPRILPIMVPQKLKLINNTTVGANFKWDGLANSPFNVLVAREDTREIALNKAERAPSPVADGIHPWLIAYLLPLDHPYAAVSGTDGIARLANLPEGEWTFRFWHEKKGYLPTAETGQREFKIKIEPGENRLALKVSPDFTVTAETSAGDKPDGAQADPSEPDAIVKKELQQAGSLQSDPHGRVTEIYLGPTASDDLLQQIGRLPKLKKLHIELARQLTAKGFESLAELPALESLGLYDVPLPKGALASLARIRSLTELSLAECGLTDAGVAPLAGCTQLTSLSLRGNALTDAGLDSVVKLTRLEVLDLGNSSSVGSEMQITDEGLAKLSALKRLKQLNLSSTRLPLGFTDKGLAHLSAFPDLESLDVAGLNLGDGALLHIGRCPNLRHLGLHFGGFTDEGMKEIRNLTKLKAISISSGQLTEQGLIHLGDLPKLEFAELRTSGVTDRVMERLAQIKSLARLDLYASSQPGVAVSLPPFTGRGLAHFKDHPGLRTLWLTNVEIDDSLLAALKELTQLGELTLMMPRLSDDSVRELQAALPKTRVHAVWGGHSIAPVQMKLPRKGDSD